MKLRFTKLLKARRGSIMVLALMISLLLMVLITGTVALSMLEVETVQDFARNKKTLQAADSGLAHGGLTLAHALSSFSIPASARPADIRNYANEALAGNPYNDADISLLKDTGQYIDEVLPRQLTSIQGYTEYGGETGLNVDYDVALNITPTGVDRPPAHDVTQKHTFHYQYQMDSEGGAQIGGQANEATRRESGVFDVVVERPNFSSYGYFTQNMKNQFGSQLWFYDGEVYGGPTHVNSAPPSGQCAFWGTPTFNGAFSAVQQSYDQSLLGGNADPQFNGGASWGVDAVPLPSNSWSQLRASLGDIANVYNENSPPPAPDNNELRSLLGLPAGGAVDQGVYYSKGFNTDGSLLGGIFVNGNAQSIGLQVVNGAQQITITMNNADGGHFNGTHTWVFQDNKSTGHCTVSYDGADPVQFGRNLNGMVYTQGNILSLAGNSGGQALQAPDIQTNHELTISTSGNIYVTNHITYEDNPVTNPDAVNILGLYSSNGNILLGRDAPSGLTVNATVMAGGTGKGVGAEGITTGNGSYDYNYPNKGNWNLLGGLIENVNQTTGVFYTNGHVTGYTWNFTYDERFLDGHAPPFFPYVTRFVVTMLGVQPENWGRKYF